jgi:hypothetical protein
VRFLRGRSGSGNGSPGPVAASSAAVEPLEDRTMMSAGAANDVSRLRLAWAVSGSPQLTMKFANDAAQPARRAAGSRGGYDTNPARAGASDPAATTSVAALASSAPVTAAAVATPVLPVMPNSDTWYGAIVNANNYITSPYYQPYVAPNLKLITDLAGTDQVTWADAVATTQANHPNTLIGTYHSSRDAQYAGSFTSYPRRAVPREGLNNSQILMTEPSMPEAYVVDYRQTAARKYLVKNVVQDVVATGSKLAYLDNVSHEETGWPIPWSTTMSMVTDMTSQLHNLGKRVIINAAWVPGVTSDTSVTQLINSGVDGVSLEMGFHGNIRNDITRINKAMSQYRRMHDSGLTVIFIGLGSATGQPDTIENIEAEQRVQAAFGMMFRKPGDRLFTNEIFWRPIPEWTDWPSRFGAPLAAATVARNAAGEIVMTRPFANTTLTLNVTTKTVTYT